MEDQTIEFETDDGGGGITLTLTGPGKSTILLYSWDEDGAGWKDSFPAVNVRDWLNANLPA